MGLRPKHIYNRLNRARLDSAALQVRKAEIIQVYREVKGAHRAWMNGAPPSGLVRTSQSFIDILSDIFLVSRKNLTLMDRPRPHSRDSRGRLSSELHGVCTYDGNIRIYLRTAAREKPTAFKTYFNTLVHEWVHHYDFEALGDTIHCAGFYHRIGSINACCTLSEEDSCQSEENSCQSEEGSCQA